MKEKDSVIERLTKENEKWQEVIRKQNEQIEALNREFGLAQNQRSSIEAEMNQVQ